MGRGLEHIVQFLSLDLRDSKAMYCKILQSLRIVCRYYGYTVVVLRCIRRRRRWPLLVDGTGLGAYCAASFPNSARATLARFLSIPTASTRGAAATEAAKIYGDRTVHTQKHRGRQIQRSSCNQPFSRAFTTKFSQLCTIQLVHIDSRSN